MNAIPLAVRSLREQVVLAQCEAFAVLVTTKELEAGGLGRNPRPVLRLASAVGPVTEDGSGAAD